MESDARVIKEAAEVDGGRRCEGCGKPIRSGGKGQQPSYCPGRACSSKAYRTRLKARQDSALASSVNDSREPVSSLDDKAAREVARLGSLVESKAHDLARTLDKGEAGLGLSVDLSGLEQAVQALLRRARQAVRQVEVRQAQADRQGSREPLPAAPEQRRQEHQEAAAERPAAPLPAVRQAPPAPAVPRPANACLSRPANASREAARSELTGQQAELTGSREAQSEVEEPLILVPPQQRPGLGNPRFLRALDEIGTGWHLYHWDNLETMYLVVRDNRAVGWVEYGLWGTRRWISVVLPNSYVAGPEDDSPLLHTSPALAARTVALTVRQLADRQARG
ncbi:hypothetical protein [Streptomyces sp. NRRL S-495]|uniref:hypothetical protein n=1 Tax=Streptomyces sp. NRRL S-495 TaxID=1609133 RepID=UPI0005F92D45|nr:hypothetical protein [Streptomyces sp. NRRL S-495]KJY27425.1 hypothetical protein VR45_34870 [Streptomyces sp. NRRL S-495]